MAYDSVHSQTVLFGGDSDNSYVNDTWLWNGTNWTQASPSNMPPERANAGMAFDSAQGMAVLFGGQQIGGNNLNDTWLWDGSNWSEVFPQSSPTPRHLFGMAYDSAQGQVILFGGLDSEGNALGDTWVWNGSNWTQQSGQTSPPARLGTYLASDSVRGQVVLFGGFTANGTVLNDTWVWNGTNWTQQSPQTSPSARGDGGMVFDTKQGQAVLFGGYSAVGTFGDTWLWNGSNWTEEFLQLSPQARAKYAMAFDSGNNVTVVFGGRNKDSFFLGDTWTYGVPASVTPPGPVINLVLSASAYGAFSSVAPGSWIEIYGTNLAPETTGWTAADFTGNNAPTTLDTVSVSIAGQPAFVDYISATQVNVQLPSGIATGGPLQLTLTNGTETSAPVNVTVNKTEAGLLAPASFKVGASQYVVAQHLDGTYDLPTGAIAGVTSSPAQPGETIVIYGVGFGSVVPNIPAGQIVTKDNQLSASLQILFGKTAAKLSYFGLAPSEVGVYQFDIVVPAIASSDLVPLTFNLGGVASTQTLFTAVQQ
jgi:uncharacterized protein (TIGR03437 family)